MVNNQYIYILYLVGGFKHEFYCPFHISESSFPLTNSYFFKMVIAPPTSKCELSVAFENAQNWDFHMFQPDADINQIQNEDILPNKSLGDDHNFHRLVVSNMFYLPI